MAKKAAKKKSATKKSTGKNVKASASQAAKQAASDSGVAAALFDLRDELAKIKDLLRLLLQQRTNAPPLEPPRSPLPAYPPLPQPWQPWQQYPPLTWR
jgi:hypothetical protein